MANSKVPGEHIYKGMRMPGIYPPNVLDRVTDFEFRSDDILLVSYPKSGTTWLQYITWLIMNGMDKDRTPLHERSLQVHKQHDIDILPTLKSPRIIKNHLPYSFFKKAIDGEGNLQFKVVVVMRNVKDVLVSSYHFYKMSADFGNFNQSFEAFFDLFEDRTLLLGDYFDHVLSWWNERENPNLYFLKYEDMKEDPKREITKLASFLGKRLTDSEIVQIIKESSFESMQNNDCTNMSLNPEYNSDISKFMRKGEVGDWQYYFTDEQQQSINSRIQKELVSKGLEFKYI